MGKIPGPRARLHRDGKVRDEQMEGLGQAACPGAGQPLGWRRVRAAPRYRSPSNGESVLLVPCHTLCLCFKPRGDKGLGAGSAWGLWVGKDEPRLNQNQEAGLLGMARRRMLRAGQAGRRTCQAQLTIGSLETMKN